MPVAELTIKYTYYSSFEELCAYMAEKCRLYAECEANCPLGGIEMGCCPFEEIACVNMRSTDWAKVLHEISE